MKVLELKELPQTREGYKLVKIQNNKMTFEKHQLQLNRNFKDTAWNAYIEINSEPLGIITLKALPIVIQEYAQRIDDIFQSIRIDIVGGDGVTGGEAVIDAIIEFENKEVC